MILADIKNKVKNSSAPVAQLVHGGKDFKTLGIAFKKGMILKAHQAHIKSKLTVLEGEVKYIENDRTIVLSQYHDFDIPIKIIHSVEAVEDSLCLLTQG